MAQSFRRGCPYDPVLVVKGPFQNCSIIRVGATAEQACRNGPRARVLVACQFLHRCHAESHGTEESTWCRCAKRRHGSWAVQLLVKVMRFRMNQAGVKRPRSPASTCTRMLVPLLSPMRQRACAAAKLTGADWSSRAACRLGIDWEACMSPNVFAAA